MTPFLAYGQAVAARAPVDAPEEVNVRGKRNEVGQTTLAATDVREMPGAFGDPFRAVEALPGVTPILSGAPYFYVRGAPPANNGYFLDGIRVPLLFHVGLAEGVIHPGLVERVDFFPGAPPAAYGGYAGAIIAGRTKDPRPELHGEANLRLVDAGALVEAPFAGERATALVAARYGYPGFVVGLITDDMKLEYWDYQARVAVKVSDRDTLGVFAFGSHDLLATKANGGGGAVPAGTYLERIASDFHRLDVRWDHALDGGNVRIAATLGHDDQGTQPTYLVDRSVAARIELDRQLTPSLRLRAGARAAVDDYDIDQRGVVTDETPLLPSPATPRTNGTGHIYSDVVWHITPRVEVVPGVRADLFRDLPTVDPRLATRITLTDRVVYLATAGLAHQLPALRVGEIPAEVVTMPGFVAGQKRTQEVAQASQGFEVSLPAEIKVKATAFLAGWTSLTDVTAMCTERHAAFEEHPVMPTPPPLQYDCPSNDPVHGRAYGLELLARRPLSKRLSGWISYTLSRSTREAHLQGQTVTVASEGDRTHVLNAIAAYDLGRRWKLGGRFVFFTGSPYSKLEGSIPVPPFNSLRFDPFYRVDARLEKRWALGKTGSIAFVGLSPSGCGAPHESGRNHALIVVHASLSLRSAAEASIAIGFIACASPGCTTKP